MRYVTLFFMALLCASGVAAQPLHDHAIELPLRPAPAQYVLRARVLSAEGAIQCWMELNYTNVSAETLTSLIFDLPKADDLILDSILWMGAPLDSTRIDRAGRFLTLRIPLKPGESAPLLMSFRSRIDGLKRFAAGSSTVAYSNNWYPSILAQHNGTWSVGGQGISPMPEVGDYRVELVVDTPYQIVAPGQFANEVEHYGLIPERTDSIIYDLYANAASVTSEEACTGYFVASGCEQFNFALLRNPQAVRIIRDKQKLDLYSIEQLTQSVQTKFTEEATRIAEQVIEKLGPIPDGRFAAIIDRRQFDAEDYGRLARISTSSRDPNILLADLAVALIGQYFTSSLPGKDDLPWSEGAVIYTTASILHGIYGDEGYNMLADWIDWRLPPRAPRSFFSPPAFAWMESIRKPNRPWSADDSLFYEAIVVAPSAIQVTANSAGADKVDAAILKSSLATRYRHSPPGELADSIAEGVGNSGKVHFKEWIRRPRTFDWSVEKVDLKRQSEGYQLSFDIRAHALPSMAVEVAIVAGGDTLRHLLVPSDTSDGRLTFTQKVADRPESIVIDPRHLLPDRNRQNNFHSFQFARSRYNSNESVFPTFRRLIQGD